MAELSIVEYGNSVLRSPGLKVKSFDETLKKLADDMIETMQSNSGVGLAAQQVDRIERLIVIDLSPVDEEQEPFALVNPEVTQSTPEKCVIEEGCLSFPGLRLEIERPTGVNVEAYDLEGNLIEIQAEGFLARVLQHEIDHINGRLFIDYIHPLKRKFTLKQWEKSRKAAA